MRHLFKAEITKRGEDTSPEIVMQEIAAALIEYIMEQNEGTCPFEAKCFIDSYMLGHLHENYVASAVRATKH